MSDQAPTTVTAEATLREIIGPKMPLAIEKEMPRLDHHCRNFIALSPFLCIGTMGPDGKADVSPRGDPPGFVKVLDDRTILIPDRPGNRRVDSMTNITANPSVGIIFLVPGMEETLRLNGRATIVRDPALLADMAVGRQSAEAGHQGRDRRGIFPLRQGAQAIPPVGSGAADRSQDLPEHGAADPRPAEDR